jgi:hypothetical protein
MNTYCSKKRSLDIPDLGRAKQRWQKSLKNKGSAKEQQPTTVWRFGTEEPPLSQIAKVICGRAFVSIHMRPVSTPSLRSVGHSPHVHGTQAQIYLATSPYLNVGRNSWAQDRKTEDKKPKARRLKENAYKYHL